jgi:hypothetical protein
MNWTNILNFTNALGSAATAIALIFAVVQIKLTKKQQVTEFEDDLNREYREIIARIPVKAMFEEKLSDKEYEDALKYLYRYIDLSNEEVFLRQRNRISDNTWSYWCEGIKSNLERYPFKEAWKEIKTKTEPRFSELRRLEESDFSEDPIKWI